MGLSKDAIPSKVENEGGFRLQPQNYNNIDHTNNNSSPLNTSGVQAHFFNKKANESRISGGTFDLKGKKSPNAVNTHFSKDTFDSG